jgi:hypothetical protein
VKAEDVAAGAVQVVGDGGQLHAQRLADAVELGVHGVGVGLVVHAVQQCLDPRPAALGVTAIRLAA